MSECRTLPQGTKECHVRAHPWLRFFLHVSQHLVVYRYQNEIYKLNKKKLTKTRSALINLNTVQCYAIHYTTLNYTTSVYCQYILILDIKKSWKKNLKVKSSRFKTRLQVTRWPLCSVLFLSCIFHDLYILKVHFGKNETYMWKKISLRPRILTV